MLVSAAWPGTMATAVKSAVTPAPIKKALDMWMRLLNFRRSAPPPERGGPQTSTSDSSGEVRKKAQMGGVKECIGRGSRVWTRRDRRG